MKLLFALLAILSGSAHASTAGRISDATLATAVVSSIAFMPTWEKRGIAAGTHVVSAGLNYGLKKLLKGPRPDGSDDMGMPSGHSQAAMTGAGLICREYGGLPCAGGVGLGLGTMIGRVAAGRHTVDQVLVGGSIGFGLGFWGVTLTGVW